MTTNSIDGEMLTAGLARQLRSGTEAAHRHAERSPLMLAILRGTVPRRVYASFLSRLEPVYAVLEHEMRRNAEDPILERIQFPQLERSARLRADLKYFGVAPCVAPARLPPAARRYVERLQRLSTEDPGLLVAHAYTRYLGDLSGGQVVAQQLRKALSLDGAAGLSFYDFPEIQDLDAFKHTYRKILDELPMAPDMRERVVSEARLAFAYNRGLADEVWEEDS